MNLCGGLVCVVDKTAAVADFGVEHLAGGECFVGLDEINDVIRHLVVGTPGDVLHLVGDEHGRDVVLLLEYFGGVGGEGGCFVGARKGDDGCREDVRKITYILFLDKDMREKVVVKRQKYRNSFSYSFGAFKPPTTSVLSRFVPVFFTSILLLPNFKDSLTPNCLLTFTVRVKPVYSPCVVYCVCALCRSNGQTVQSEMVSLSSFKKLLCKLK